jgi:hypothetical protein
MFDFVNRRQGVVRSDCHPGKLKFVCFNHYREILSVRDVAEQPRQASCRQGDYSMKSITGIMEALPIA